MLLLLFPGWLGQREFDATLTGQFQVVSHRMQQTLAGMQGLLSSIGSDPRMSVVRIFYALCIQRICFFFLISLMPSQDTTPDKSAFVKVDGTDRRDDKKPLGYPVSEIGREGTAKFTRSGGSRPWPYGATFVECLGNAVLFLETPTRSQHRLGIHNSGA
jgi:hypothetical protein